MTDNIDRDPDIVEIILDACKAEGFDPEIARLIELKVCSEYGGRRVYISKKKVHQEKVRKAYSAGLTTKSTAEIVKETGVSRATLYRLMKQGA